MKYVCVVWAKWNWSLGRGAGSIHWPRKHKYWSNLLFHSLFVAGDYSIDLAWSSELLWKGSQTKLLLESIAQVYMNIARGTVDQGIDSITWSYLINYKFDQRLAPLALLQIWPPGSATCINCKFGHQVASLALPHCLGFSYWHHQFVLVSYQPESNKLSQRKVLEFHLDSMIGPHGIPGPRYTWVC